MGRSDEESYLTKIPILGYFFRKVKENRKDIEKALKTGKRVKGKIKKGSFLFGIFKIVSQKTFEILKSKKKDG